MQDSGSSGADVLFVGRMASTSDVEAFTLPSVECVIMLRERSGPRQLAVEGVDASVGEAVERLLAREKFSAADIQELLPRLVLTLGASVKEVTVRSLVGMVLYADITLERDGRRSQVDARPGEAVALALGSGAPIKIATTVMEEAGFDPGDRRARRRRLRLEAEERRQRIARRTGPPPQSPVPPPRRLELGTRQKVEESLERVRTDLDGRLALLMHDSGAVVAWVGIGDSDVVRLYCQARADRDFDLTYLAMGDVFPPVDVEAIAFRSVARLWRLEVGLAVGEPKGGGRRVDDRIDEAMWELEALLATHRRS
jgi:bifunctional DNase/RNase